MEEGFKLPHPLLQHLNDYADKAGVTPEQYVTISVAEKIARAEHEAWLEANRPRRIKRAKTEG